MIPPFGGSIPPAPASPRFCISWSGKQSWESLFKRPIEHARNGFPVTSSQKFWQGVEEKNLKDWPDIQRIFMPNGKIPEVGEKLVQPQLANSLEMLATNGGRDFYEGQLAERVAAGLKAMGSPLIASDLARCRAREETPQSGQPGTWLREMAPRAMPGPSMMPR
ncbi:gamma-glutamyltransferase [Bradyrhizobium sp.]|uniref:gamma-glutamyltransferase n=1 Tax=Bradyrhizobium sp. TaxID=376 RepID=UPI00260B5DDE|nr:gamma-glutamyltransferase [Bradyrhizobium sp.]